MTNKKMLDRIIRKNSTSEANAGGFLFSRDDNSASPFVKIGWDKYISFWQTYCEELTKNPNSFDNVYLYEYNQEETSLRFTFSFKFVKPKSNIEDHEIERIIPAIRDTIFKNLQLDSEEAIACVSMSCSPNGNNIILDFSFPAIRIDKGYFNKIIHPNFCEILRSHEVKAYFPEFKSDWEDIIFNLSSFSPVYGCKFSKDDPPLKFIGLWSSNEEKLGEDIFESFTAKKHALIVSNCAREIDCIDEENINYSPLILSSRYARMITLPKNLESSSRYSHFTEVSSSLDIDMIYHLLPLVSNKRFECPMYRWQIGRCIYNIFNGESTGLELFNSHCSKYDEENTKYWKESFPNDIGVNDFLSIRTIGYFVKIDNPDEYQVWHNSWISDAVSKSLDKVELNVAEVMYRLLWLEFTTVGLNEWYRFSLNGNKLYKSVANVEFNRRFNDVIHFYSKVLADNSITFCNNIMIKEDNDDLKSTSLKKNKAIGEIISKLGTNGFQRAIEKHCFIKFYREGVDKYFDTNPSLLAWSNCISEVHNGQIFCRPGKMEDFITMSSDISYNFDDYTWEHAKIKEVLYWFKTAFVEPDLIDCFLKICSSFLYGRNVEKSVYAFCGPSGDNSKSMVQKLLERLFSVYCINFPVSVLTDAKQSNGGPSPELAQAKGARIANVAEPDGRIPFMGSLIKRYSGGDSFFARGNHKDGGSVEAMFKMILYCNAVPPIEGADQAVENRLKIIPFLSKYCNDAPIEIEEQFRLRRFPKDLDFDKKLNLFRRPMLWIIINYYEKYSKEGITLPAIAVEYTRKYWEDNDPYKLFKNENLVFTNNPGDKITITNCYKVFKIWYTTNFNTKKSGVPDLSTMVRHLSTSNMLGDPKNRIWDNWRIQLPANSDFNSTFNGSSSNKKHAID